MTPEDLVEIEAIKRLKYAYARCIDQKLWDEIATLFTADAVAAYSGGGYTFEGRDAIVEWTSNGAADRTRTPVFGCAIAETPRATTNLTP